MAGFIRFLLEKNEYQNLDPRVHINDGCVWHPICNPSTQEKGREVPRASWLVRPAELVSSGFGESPCLSK